MEATTPRAGLRERKKQKTRDTIIDVALELFAKQGYEHTTIAEIADAAEVSRRTIFTYFPSKEDILFYDLTEVEEHLEQALRERPEGTTALDVLREFIVGSLTPDSAQVLRKCIVADDEMLKRNERARYAPLERLMAKAIAEDLDTTVDDIRPQIVAGSIFAAFNTLHDPAAPPEPFSPEHAMRVIDDVIGFLRGGLEALRRP
jgi:AcrR family transcriptional regulator